MSGRIEAGTAWALRHARGLLAAGTALLAVMVMLAGLGSLAPPSPHWRPGPAYPRIQQAAGVIDLFRRLDPALRPAALRALDGRGLEVSIGPAPPLGAGDLRRAPRVEDKLREFAAPGLVGLSAFVDARYPSRTTDTEGWPAKVVWTMPDGQVLVLDFIERQVPLTALPAWPRPVLIGLAGVGVAAAALVLACRERTALARVVAAAERFDGRPAPPLAAPAGGPEIRRLAGAVDAMQRRLTLLLQERSFLIGAISHDLKTYLTRLRLRAETVHDEAQRGKMADDLEAMSDLIDMSLAFARGTSVSRHMALVDLADLVAIEAAEREAMDRPIETPAFKGDASVLGDPVALRRVIGNLVDNALKFGRGRAAMSLEEDEMGYRLLVDDDGPGVADTERAVIFSPFFRLEGSRSRLTGGSGLGLAIARQIVEAHGGALTIADGPLGGARFIATIPKPSAGNVAA